MKNVKWGHQIKKISVFFLFLFLILPVGFSKAQTDVKIGDVIINEVMWMGSTLSAYDEWIELKNMTDREINLENFQITKKSSGQEKLMLIIPSGKVIPPSGYFLVTDYDKEHSKINIDPDLVIGLGSTNDTNFALVNTDLQIKLYKGDWSNSNNLIDTADDGMGTPFAGDNTTKASMERNDPPGDGTFKENWHTAITSVNFDPGAIEKGTPKAENSQTDSFESDSEGEEIVTLISIKDARQQQKDADVLVEGVVTVNKGTFSLHYIYIQDQTAGIQVYYYKDLPGLSLGQRIRVLGTISEAYNEKRIKIAQSQDISSLGQEKEPGSIALKTGQINEDHEGMLVKVAGKVVNPSGSTFYLDDGSGKIKIYIKKETKIEKPRLSEGQSLEVAGIVSQYKDSYRILPRKNDDLKTATGQTLTSATTKKKKKGAGSSEGDESETEEELTSSEEMGKVLGAFAEKSKQNWWLILLGLGVLGGGGYLGYDFYLQKRKGNSKIWSKIGPVLKRWRSYWANWRSGRW